VTWQLTLHPLPLDLPWLYRLWKVRMAGEALNESLPMGGFGGEPMKLLVATRTYGLGGRHVTASLILTRTINILALVGFLGIGFAFVLRSPALPDSTKWAAGIGLAALTAGVLGFFAVQSYGVATHVIRMLDGFAVARRAAVTLDHIRAVDERLADFYRRDLPRFAAAMAGALANWALGALETFVILWVIGYPVSFVDAWIIEAATQLARAGAFFVPAAIGVQEGAFVLICGMLTGSPAAGFATALIRRLRQIVWMAWGLLIAAGFRRRPDAGGGAADIAADGRTAVRPDRTDR
ncbi:MAG: lysylphosphatidylglycerol synthase domain-containing protein, partial [Alphaproteobacteria bacterium]